MEDWRLVCLLVVLAALLSLGPAGAPEGRRRGPVPKPGETGTRRKMGGKTGSICLPGGSKCGRLLKEPHGAGTVLTRLVDISM